MKLIFFVLLLVISSGFVFSDAFADVTITPDSGSGSSTDNCVDTQYGCYSPGIASVDYGETVRFSNTDSAAHTWTAGTASDGPTGEFDTSMVMAGNSYEWTADVSGSIPYFCAVHPWMDGLIKVESKPVQTYPGSAPYGTDVTIPRDTGSPGCENSNSCYSPYKLSIDEGETISWYNADSAAHTVTSGTPSNGPDGVFDSSMLMAGKSFSHKFYNSGTYNYFCMVHPWMVGVVSVTAPYVPPAPTPTPTPIPTGNYMSVVTVVPDSGSGSSTDSCVNTQYGCYSPGIAKVKLGGKVIFSNTDSAAHTFSAGTGADGPTGEFDTSMVMAGNSYEWTADVMGEIPYFCMVHPWMDGLIIVGEGTAPIPEPTPTPEPTPSLPIPDGTNIVIPSGTGSPGCENSNSCYEPRTFSAGKYSTITWFNADSAAHTVTSGTPGKGPSGEFDSSLFMSGATFSHRFVDDGTYNYFCTIHPWMEGKVSITRSGPIISPPTTTPSPTPVPTPTPTPAPTPGSISVSVDDTQYSPGELVTVKVSASKSTHVAISVIDPNQDSVVSRSVSTDSRGSGSLQFKLPESSQNGTYRIDSTATISGSKVSDSTSFSVKSTAIRISIVSLQPTDQQGNVVSSFTKGKLGFAKIVLSSDSAASSLVTINLFDSDLTSLGIGSFKTTLSSGQSEMTLSFFIPNDAEFGTGDIYANVFSDWPSQGGVPLTGESSSQVRIQ